jgi:hypothetical protein
MIIRSFVRYGNEENTSNTMKETDKQSNLPDKKISKKIGEYIDYEEVDKNN